MFIREFSNALINILCVFFMVKMTAIINKFTWCDSNKTIFDGVDLVTLFDFIACDSENKLIEMQNRHNLNKAILIKFSINKLRNIAYSICFVFLSLIIFMFLPKPEILFNTIVIYILIIFTYSIVFIYRIEKGLFGTNFYEAKELLSYITINNNNFKNGNKLFNEEQIDKMFFKILSKIQKGSIPV